MTGGLYLNSHRSQYGADRTAITRSSGCTWTSAANGADAATGGLVALSPDEVHALVANHEETNPVTPGWSLSDVDLAMARLKVPFEIRSGRGWAAVEAALEADCGVILQGDSDRFSDATCSGAFDGDHAIFVHPDRDAAGRQRIADPICLAARYESRMILRLYSEKLSPGVLFGVFTTRVPGGDEMPDIAPKFERATLDGGAQVTTLGAPLKADGTVDFSRRLALVGDRLTLIDRTRLTNITGDQDAALRAALAGYALPSEAPSSGILAVIDAALAAQDARIDAVQREIAGKPLPSGPGLVHPKLAEAYAQRAALAALRRSVA